MTKKSSRDQSTSSVQNISKAGIASSRGSDKTHNNNLYICALLTYGCLFRPHHEIRLLRWGDFSDDLSYITLSGSRVKSKRNRVVPVPEYVRKELTVGYKNNNIFSGDIKPYNRS
jgi:integrase